MKERGYDQKFILLKWVTVFVIAIIVIIFATLYFHASPRFEKQIPAAEKGRMDLSAWDFNKNGVVELKGEWECYDGQLLLPEDFSGGVQQKPRLTGYAKLTADGMESPGAYLPDPMGVRTFRLVVKTSPAVESLALNINNVKMSSRVYINGILQGAGGNPAEKEKGYQAKNAAYAAFFLNDKAEEILLQTANYDVLFHQFLYALILGNQNDILSRNNILFAVEFSGTILFSIFGLFCIFLYSVNLKDKSLLAASLMYFFMAAIFPFGGIKYIYSLIPDMPYELFARLRILILMGQRLSIVAYANAINKKVLPDAFARIIFIAGSIYCFAVLTAPLDLQVYLKLDAAAPLFFALVYVYILWKSWMFYRKTPPGSDLRVRVILHSVCLSFVLVTLINTFLYTSGLAFNNGINSVAICIFSISSLIVLAYRFSHNYKSMIMTNKLKDEFITKTSYNLKSSLSSLVTLSEALVPEDRKESLGEEDYQKTVAIKDTALRLLDLVNSTLDVAVNQFRLAIAPVDMRACAEQVTEAFAEAAQNRKIQFLVNIPEGLTVKADESKVKQILWNLVQNSVQNMEEGTVTLYGRKTGDRVRVSVEDTGYGIPEEGKGDIFKPYTALKSQGIGLGLYISRQLLELMGGEIRLEWSRINEGSCFVFSLPAYTGKLKPDGTEKKPERRLKSALADFFGLVNGKKPEHAVLIVDVEKSDLRTASHILQKEGYEILTAVSGEEALHIIEENKVDLVLLDIMLPDQSGIDLCGKIREKYSFIELPVLISTISGMDNLDLAMKEGANDFILKPFEEKDMIAKIKTLIALKSLDSNVDELVQVVKVRTLTVLKTLTEDAVKSELAFLQAQIKPHFIYNAINTIASFCYTDGEKAADLLANFSKYLRLIFDMDSRLMLIPLEREIEMIMAYAEIEKARFGDLIRVEYDIAPELMNMEIPPLCIQPLVENAIKHGLCRREGGGTVSVSAKEDNGAFVIRVRDTGTGMPAEQVELLKSMEYDGEAVGFYNVSRRIRGWRNARLDIQSTEGEGTVVTITIG